MKIISMRGLCGATILSGAPRGEQVLLKLLEQTRPEPLSPQPLLLDFNGIDVATGSFLRESVLSLRDLVRGKRSNWYPVIANASDVVLEDLLEVLRDRGGAMVTCATEAGVITHWSLLGKLEPKQRLTYDLVCKKGETDAIELMRELNDTERLQSATAWNNRLASLVSLGLIFELSHGRTKKFQPIFSGV